ncbi:MAG: hypothetical protein HKP27_02355 [Myxococcales bacterium]|nr:hypothetical protein [Myxococcales bacterium]
MGSFAKLAACLLVAFGAWKLVFAPNEVRSDVPYPLKYRVQVVGETTDERMPLLFALHGSGADENDLDGVFAQWNFAVRVVSFRGPVRHGGGYIWDQGRGSSAPEAKAAQMNMFREVAASIAAAAGEISERYATKGKPMVFGFSRGASLAWYLGAHHPEHFGAIFAVAGALEPDLLEGMGPGARPPFFAYHGRSDSVIPISRGRRTADALSALTRHVYFQEFDGRHSIPELVRADVQEKIRKLHAR